MRATSARPARPSASRPSSSIEPMRRVPVEHGRYLAAHIPGATYVELPGIDNLIWAGDQDADRRRDPGLHHRRPAGARAIARSGDRPVHGHRRLDAGRRRARRRPLAPVCSTSTIAVARRPIERFGGHEVKTTGDGIVATFDGPARAIRCAAAIRDGVRELGLEIRAGLHTGEIEVQRIDIAGHRRPHRRAHLGARRRWRGARLGDGQGPRRRLRLHLRGPRDARAQGRARRVADLSARGALSLTNRLRRPTPEHVTRAGARVHAVAHDADAVHEHVVHPDRELVRLLERGPIRDRRRVEHDDVRDGTFPHDAAVAHPHPASPASRSSCGRPPRA